VLPELLADHLTRAREHRPANIPELDFPAELIAALGMIPSDYLRYFYLQREMIAEQAAKPRSRAEEVMEIERELLAIYADPSHSEKPPSLSKRGGAYYSHAAIEVIEGVANDSGAVRTVDVLNGATVKELPPEVVVEVPCRIGAAGATPLPQAPLEPAIRGLIQHVKAYEELAVTAAVEKNKRAALLALSAHPLVPSVQIAAEIVEALSAELGLE
jgi:6-phospho-beta-glucosidase